MDKIPTFVRAVMTAVLIELSWCRTATFKLIMVTARAARVPGICAAAPFPGARTILLQRCFFSRKIKQQTLLKFFEFNKLYDANHGQESVPFVLMQC